MTKGVEAAQLQAWERIVAYEPADVCRRTLCTWDTASRRYSCLMLGQNIVIDPAARTLSSETALGQQLLGKLGYFTRISLLQYLVHARDLPPANRLVSAADLTAGQIYFRGSHVLPTDAVAARFAAAPEQLQACARQLAARPLAHGDTAFELRPLPRLPLALVLWRGDDEFPARANMLFDADCEAHVPPDIVWSVAMLSLLLLLAMPQQG